MAKQQRPTEPRITRRTVQGLVLASLVPLVVAATWTRLGTLVDKVWPSGHAASVTAGASPSPAAATAGPAPSAIPVRRTGTLVMPTNVAFDLDSTAPDWEPTKGEWGNSRDVAYASWVPQLSNDALIGLGYYWSNVAALPGAGPWTRADCAGATYGLDTARPVGDRIALGHGVCVHTTAGRFALLVVTDDQDGSITVTVTVWER